MQITTRAAVLTVMLLASAPLLAAGSGTTMAGTDVSTQDTPTTEQDDCWLPTLPSTDLSAEVDLHLSKAAPCVRPFGFLHEGPEDGTSRKRGYFVTAMPAATAWPRQDSLLEDSSGTGGLSVPTKAWPHF